MKVNDVLLVVLLHI